MAVPGSVRNPAAAGTNLLLSEGCAPACCTEDVLVALGLATAGVTGGAAQPEGVRGRDAPGSRMDSHGLEPLQQRLLDLLDDGPVSLDVLVLRAAAPVPAVLVAADGLERRGLMARDGARVLRA